MKTFKHVGALLLTVLLGLCCILAGCAEDPKLPQTYTQTSYGVQESFDNFYRLETCYDNGWISEETLKKIAEVYNEEKSSDVVLDRAIEERMTQSIRDSYIVMSRVVDEEAVALDRYYGCFDGFYVVSFVEDWTDNLWANENSTKIGDVEFLHGESGSNSNLPYLWKEA